MDQKVDVQRLEELVEQLEANLQELKQALNSLSDSRAVSEAPRQEEPAASLYGIFPRSDVSWEDFRETRASWTRAAE